MDLRHKAVFMSLGKWSLYSTCRSPLQNVQSRAYTIQAKKKILVLRCGNSRTMQLYPCGGASHPAYDNNTPNPSRQPVEPCEGTLCTHERNSRGPVRLVETCEHPRQGKADEDQASAKPPNNHFRDQGYRGLRILAQNIRGLKSFQISELSWASGKGSRRH